MNVAQRYTTLNPDPLWTIALGQPSIKPPIIIGDLLLVAAQESDPFAHPATLHALDLSDGTPRWHHSFEYTMITGLTTTDDYILLTLTSTNVLRSKGALISLDATGKERCRWSPGVKRVSAPAVSDNLACLTADASSLVVLDLPTCQEQPRIPLEATASLSAPALVDGVAYVSCRGPHLLAVPLDKKKGWHFEIPDIHTAWLDKTPVLVGDHLFTVLSTGEALALHTNDGSLIWRESVGPTGKRLSAPTTDGRRLYIGARDGLHALDLTDGAEVWTFPTSRRIEAAPVVTGGVVYATCHDHHTYAIDTTTGRELWHYELERRIQISPALATYDETPYLLAVDHGGTLVALARPLSAAEHEDAGRWTEAASAYAALDQPARAAQLLEDHYEPLQAAQLWQTANEPERAAQQYEAAGAWQQAVDLWAALDQPARAAQLLEDHDEPLQAAQLWQAANEPERAAQQYEAAGAWQQIIDLWTALDRPLKRAEALEGYARSLESEHYDDQKRADAWAAAADAFEIEGETERAAACLHEVARCLHQPIIMMDVEHKGLVLDTWSRLQFIVRNQGYGPARNLVIRAIGDQFEGQVTATRQIVTLKADSSRTDWLDVCPREPGDFVPLRVRAEYQDHTGKLCSCERTIYIAVARAATTRGQGEVIGVIGSGQGAKTQRQRELAATVRTQKQALVDALLRCPTMNDPSMRDAVVNDLPDDIKQTISRHPSARGDVNNIVSRCLDYTNGVEELLAILRSFEGDSLPMQNVDRVFSQVQAEEPPTPGPKYQVHVEGGQVGVIGDGAKIEGGIHFGPTTQVTQTAGDHATQIGTARDVHIHISSPQPEGSHEPVTTSEGKMIKILFLAANPTDTTRLRLGEESRAIDQALRQTEFRDRFDIKQHWAVRAADLQGYLLRHQPDIVHFSGHGGPSSEIILEDNAGHSHPVSVRALSTLFDALKDNIRCVVLNACFSEQQAQAIAEHIDCVIGMSTAIGDAAAISFAAAFYQALGYGRDVKTAFDLGCVQIDLENLDEQDTPKLLTVKADPSKILFVQKAEN